MVETRITCDRCRCEVPSNRTKLEPTTGPWWESGRPPLDLCPSCLEALEAWLASPIEAPAFQLAQARG